MGGNRKGFMWIWGDEGEGWYQENEGLAHRRSYLEASEK